VWPVVADRLAERIALHKRAYNSRVRWCCRCCLRKGELVAAVESLLPLCWPRGCWIRLVASAGLWTACMWRMTAVGFGSSLRLVTSSGLGKACWGRVMVVGFGSSLRLVVSACCFGSLWLPFVASSRQFGSSLSTVASARRLRFCSSARCFGWVLALPMLSMLWLSVVADEPVVADR
jgi:hypothetical protein